MSKVTSPGLALAGSPNEKIQQRVAQSGIHGYAPEASPVVFGDLQGKAGHPTRTVGSQVGRQILRGVLGGILGGSRRR